MAAELQQKFKDVNPFLLRKWEKVFTTFFDTNCSKDVDWADFYLVTRHVRNIYGAESEQMTFAQNSLKALWSGLLELGDKNKDERIELEEFVSVLRSSNAKNSPKWFLDYMTFMFKLMDVSADNKLDLAEYTDGMVTYGHTTDEAHRAFHKFSVDEKGNPLRAIEFPRFRELFMQYFYSTNPHDPGNNLFGVLQ